MIKLFCRCHQRGFATAVFAEFHGKLLSLPAPHSLNLPGGLAVLLPQVSPSTPSPTPCSPSSCGHPSGCYGHSLSPVLAASQAEHLPYPSPPFAQWLCGFPRNHPAPWHTRATRAMSCFGDALLAAAPFAHALGISSSRAWYPQGDLQCPMGEQSADVEMGSGGDPRAGESLRRKQQWDSIGVWAPRVQQQHLTLWAP